MCGIVGMAGKLTAQTDKVLKNLLILDTLRGTDSTGIAAIHRDSTTRVVKQVGNPFDLFGYKAFESAINSANRVVIGHNRFATQGIVNKKNAHPFDFDSLVGVHNGTLTNKYALKDSQSFVVDSENLYHHIEEEGLKSFLAVAEGAWSLVWWDKLEESLNFLRNKERPMWLCSDKKEEVLFWASEPWMLEVSLDRERIEFTEPLSTTVDMHYKIYIDKEGKISKPILQEAKGKEPVIWQGYNRNFHNGQASTVGTKVVGAPALTQEQRDAIRQRQQNPQQVSVTPSGKVIEFTKKKTVAPVTARAVTGSSVWYKGRKDVLIEGLVNCADTHGARYISCFDPENRHARIRLYLRSDEMPEKFVGKEMRVSIGENLYADDAKSGDYYKVINSSVKLVDEVADDSSAQTEGRYFMNAAGRLIPKTAWLEQHGTCSWCTSPVTPEDANGFTKSNDVLCPECYVDPEVAKYVELK
jgi:predicted glutamine amidotransferase